MLDHLTITVPGVPDDLRTPGAFVHVSDAWQDGATAPVAPGGSPTYADFTATPLTGTAPLTVQFTDLSSTPRGAWLWDFGDGGTSTAQNPTHVYNTPGVYTVTLTATGPDGSDSKTFTDIITVSAAGTPGTWLITSANSAHTGTLGGPWSNLPLPPGFGPSDPYAMWPTTVLSDGADGLVISGYKSGDGNVQGIASANGGADWTLLKYGVNTAWDDAPQFGAYVLGKYAVSIDSQQDGQLHVSAVGTAWTRSEINSAAALDLRYVGGICEHKGEAYISVTGNVDSVHIFKSATLDTLDWTQVASPPNVLDTTDYAYLKSDGSRLYCVSNDGLISCSDDDADTWASTAQVLSPDTIPVKDVAVGGGYIVLVSGSDTNLYIAPTSTMVFSAYTPTVSAPGFTKFRAVEFGGGKFVAVGDGGTVVSFSDPSAFTIEDAGFTSADTLNGVAFIN
jgi:PKD repeat protein